MNERSKEIRQIRGRNQGEINLEFYFDDLGYKKYLFVGKHF